MRIGMEGIVDCFYDQKVCSSIVKSHRDNIVLRALSSSLRRFLLQTNEFTFSSSEMPRNAFSVVQVEGIGYVLILHNMHVTILASSMPALVQTFSKQ